MARRDANRNMLWARALVEELHRGGLRHACVAPGSRSAPLALAFAAHEGVRVHVHLDERSAGFFGLGLAKLSGAPVALVCTSGSAGAHFYPAIIEAWHTGAPLIALTADRPPELMESGAGQTMDQLHLYGSHVRHFAALGLPEASELALRHLRTRISRLAALSTGRLGQGPPGPIHINVPFQEPLEPTPIPGDIPDHLSALALSGRAPAPFLAVSGHGRVQPALESLDAVAARLAAAERGLLVCGPTEPTEHLAEALTRLAAATGFPLLADPVSGLRGEVPGACVAYDLTLRPSAWADQTTPDVILRFGQSPTSKPYRLWRERHLAAGVEVEEIAVSPHGLLHDQAQITPRLLIGDPEWVALGLAERLEAEGARQGGPWADRWRLAEVAAGAVVQDTLESARLWEGQVAHAVLHALPQGATLYAASSMPIRDLDSFGGAPERGARVVSNRGVNGIDGLIASSLGAAMATGAPTTLLIGDVAFLHDAASLLAARRCRRDDGAPVDLTIVVIDNGGGAIFSYLPIAAHPEHFEELFLTPPGVAPEEVAGGYGIAASRVRDPAALRAALAESIRGVRVLVVEVERAFNVARHREVQLQVAEALGQGGGDDG